MTDAGFFRGTSTEQDVRFSDKDKKLLKTMKFEECLEQKVDMYKVNFEALKPWVSEQVTKIIGIEDEVVIELIFSFLEHEQFPNAKKLQILVTGFLQSKPARIFIGQLWGLLLSAQENPSKLPEKFIEDKKNAIRQQKKKIEMQLNIRADVRRYSPARDEYFRHPRDHGGRYRNASRSPHSRTSERRDRGNLPDVGTQVQKSEASSTQADLEHPGPASSSTLSRVETIIKSVEEVIQQNKEIYRGEDVRREEHRERVRSRSRSYSPSSRRHRSRSRQREDSRERRHRPWRGGSPPRRHRTSFSPCSPDSHSHHQRGRGRARLSPHNTRPLRSPEDRHHQKKIEPPLESSRDKHRHSHTENPDDRSAPASNKHREPHVLPTQESHPSTDTRRSHQHKPGQEVPQAKRRGSRSPRGRKQSTAGKDSRKGRVREQSNTSSTSSSSSSYSSGSASPVKERPRGERTKKRSSLSSSASSESESDSQHRSRPATTKHRSHAKLSTKASREPARTSKRETAKRGSVHSKRRYRRVSTESDRSEHTSDNFFELEQRRKSLLDRKSQKQVTPNKHRHERERQVVSVRSKVKKPHKKSGESVERRVAAPKRKQRMPSSEISDESEDISEIEEVGRNVVKRKHRQVSPVAGKRGRHKKSLTLDSSSISSESEDSSSSDSYSEEQGKRRKDKRKEKRPGRERKKVRVREDSSGNESVGWERGHSSLEKQLRGKIIGRQRKNKT